MSIHHWLIPTKKNNYHPHSLRPVGLLVFLFIFVTIPFLYNVTSARQVQVLGYATSISVTDLHTLTNQERVANGLEALALNSQLSSAAVAKANHMFANDYWAHIAPDGTTPWSFIYAAGYDYSVAGENLAKDFNTSSGAVAGWMASATHRANIVHTSYKDIGFGVVNGVLLGEETTLVVAMYGERVSSAPIPEEARISSLANKTPASETDTPVSATTTQPQPVSSGAAITELARSDLKGLVEGIGDLAPVKAYMALNWGQKASILLICVLLLLLVMKHTLVWRSQKKGVRHIWLRAHPIVQAVILIVLLIMTLASGAGTVL